MSDSEDGSGSESLSDDNSSIDSGSNEEYHFVHALEDAVHDKEPLEFFETLLEEVPPFEEMMAHE